MAASPGSTSPAKAMWATVLCAVAYLALALLCLWQWGTPAPWSRLDLFSGGYLSITTLAVVYGFRLGRTIFRSAEVFREASGMSYDRATLGVMAALSACDALVFLDYGRWHLSPALERHAAQGLGLLLEIAAVAWLLWTDTYLVRHFTGELSARTVIQDGPYRYVRHPRYAGVLAVRVAFALVLASVAGWLLAVAWLVVLLRRITLEERHVQEVFGVSYDAYARRTPRLLPGIY